MVPLVPSAVVVVNCKVSGTGVGNDLLVNAKNGQYTRAKSLPKPHNVPSHINNKVIYSYCLTFSLSILNINL